MAALVAAIFHFRCLQKIVLRKNIYPFDDYVSNDQGFKAYCALRIVSGKEYNMRRAEFGFRRYIVAIPVVMTSMLPLTIALPDGSIGVQSASAFAKDGNNGGGNGNSGNGNHGNGNGNGNSGSNGNSSSNSSSNSGGAASNSGKDGASVDGNAATGTTSAKSQSADDPANAGAVSPLSVHHPNGFTEAISKGSYVMTDPKGRVVIDRRARSEDVKRLKSFDR